jgi:hypothetical protein
LVFAAAAVSADPQTGAVRLWDTAVPLRAQADLAQRSNWHAVAPAASGHLQGDLVVEGEGLVAAFASRLGEVLVCSGTGSSQAAAVVRPAELRGKQATLAPTIFAQQADVTMAQADFRAPGAASLPITFTFKGDRSVAVKPEGSTQGIALSAPLDLAILPSFVGDDLIYDPKDYPSAVSLALPSEHLLLGLLKGEGGVLVMTWQEAVPSLRLDLSRADPGSKSIEAVSFMGGKGVSLALLEAPGIWHREKLGPAFFERDVAIEWKPPFSAVWLTQLYEDELKTTFEFQDEKQEHWRGGIGSYTLPAWFSDGKAMLSLGKQIPPEGEAIIYCLERDWHTPEETLTPIDIAQRTLAGGVLIDLLDVAGRPTWWPMRPDAALGGETCNVTDALKEIFDAGEEVQKQLFVRGGAQDMIFHLAVMLDRNGRYYPFATDMVAYLDAQAKAKPELTPYLQELRGIAEQMITLYDNTRDSLKDMAYARDLEAKTIALAAEHRPGNPQRFWDLKQEWIGVGGAAEELSRREHTLARKLHQLAAYRAAESPAAIPIAEQIRARTRQCLERPDSYEMWVND